MYVPTQTNKPTWTTRGSGCSFVSVDTVVLCVFRCRKERVGGKCTQPCLWDLLQLQIVNNRVGDDWLVGPRVYKNCTPSHIPQWKLLVLGLLWWSLRWKSKSIATAVAYLGILFVGEGGFNKFSWGQRTERMGIYDNNIYLLQLGCRPVAVVILHVNKTWNWLLLNLSWEGYMRSM